MVKRCRTLLSSHLELLICSRTTTDKLPLCCTQENATKKSRFCSRHFSPVSTNFWILSSGIGRTWCELASKLANFQRFDEKNIKKLVTKSENSNFVYVFRPRKKNSFFYKKNILGRSRGVLAHKKKQKMKKNHEQHTRTAKLLSKKKRKRLKKCKIFEKFLPISRSVRPPVFVFSHMVYDDVQLYC